MLKKKLLSLTMAMVCGLSLTASVYSEALANESIQTGEVVTEKDILFDSSESAKIVSEITELRKENEKHFLLDNGEYMAITYTAPVNYQDSTGTWREIDNTLEMVTVDGEELIKNKDGLFDVTFAKNGNSNELITVAKDGYSISWRIAATSCARDVELPSYPNPNLEQVNVTVPKEIEMKAEEQITAKTDIAQSSDFAETAINELKIPTQSVELKASETAIAEVITFERNDYEQLEKTTSSLIYNDVFYEGINLKYTVGSNSLKEDIILESAAEITAYNMYMSLTELTPTLRQNGSIVFADKNGESIFEMPAAYMYDAIGEESTDIDIELSDLGNGEYLLKIIPNVEWLNSNERVYPITIDPTVTTVGSVSLNLIDRIVSNNTSYNVQYKNSDIVGAGSDSTITVATLVKMTKPYELPTGARVEQAKFSMISYEVSSSSVQLRASAYMEYWDGVTQDWNALNAANTQTVSTANLLYSIYNGVGYYYFGFDITSIVRPSSLGPSGFSMGNGVLIECVQEGGYAKLVSCRHAQNIARPYMTVTYSMSEDYIHAGMYDITSDLVSVYDEVSENYLIKHGNYWLIRNKYRDSYLKVDTSNSENPVDLIALSSENAINNAGDSVLWELEYVESANSFIFKSKAANGKVLTLKSSTATLNGTEDYCLLTKNTSNERQWFNLDLHESSYTFAPALDSSVTRETTSEWGSRYYDGSRSFHHGLDISVPIGNDVYAVADGIVEQVKEDKTQGKYIKIKHFGMSNGNGDYYYTRYLHLDSQFVAVGDFVEQGTVIGESGNTGYSSGPHLHFEIMNGSSFTGNSINPTVLYNDWDKRNGLNNCNPAYLIGEETADEDYEFTFEPNPNFIFNFDDDLETDGYQKFYGTYSCPVENDIGFTGTDENNDDSDYWAG